MLNIFWFRKDLRLNDNKGLKYFIESLKPNTKFALIYIKNPDNFKFFGDKRITFLKESLSELQKDLRNSGLELQIFKGKSKNIFLSICDTNPYLNVFANLQVEPYSIKRDSIVREIVESKGGKLNLFSDSTIFDLNQITKMDSSPYSVFTPFKNKFLMNLKEENYQEYSCNLKKLNNKNQIILSLNCKYKIKSDYPVYKSDDYHKGGRIEANKILVDFCKNKISKYIIDRDFPALNSTSMLSPHLHFGTISIRECFRKAFKFTFNTSSAWINELIWREFYYNISYHFPYVINYSFKRKFDNLYWNPNSKQLTKWKDGLTGYPIVDAGMRQLKKEGWMHNRLRMITAMFLTKDLFIDWREGEKYFAENLIDLDFSSNNGGWQWSASTGCDAQPYFRIFNPILQSKKFDPKGLYIKKYVPELSQLPPSLIHNPWVINHSDELQYKVKIGFDYPKPVINHFEAKEKAISKFRQVKGNYKT